MKLNKMKGMFFFSFDIVFLLYSMSKTGRDHARVEGNQNMFLTVPREKESALAWSKGMCH